MYGPVQALFLLRLMWMYACLRAWLIQGLGVARRWSALRGRGCKFVEFRSVLSGMQESLAAAFCYKCRL